jgi:hypothetical protein
MQLALNEYADMSWEDFSSSRLGYAAKKQSLEVDGPRTPFRHINVEPAEHMDWRSFNAVTAVKNQGAVSWWQQYTSWNMVAAVRFVRHGSSSTVRGTW